MGDVDATIEIRRLRRELLKDGADPFWVAADAIQTAERLRRLLVKYEREYSRL